MKYGERLRLARIHKGLSQQELAKAAGASQGLISKIERGHQRTSSLDEELAYAVEIEASWLRTGTIDSAPYWLLAHHGPESLTRT